MTGQRVLITAGASGIGKAMAEKFLGLGARVAICDIDDDALAAMRTAHPELLTRICDVCDEAGIAALFSEIKAEWDGLDVVCANAGTGGPAGPVESLDYDAWRRCVAVNLDGAFLTARAAAALMKPQGAGAIVFTASSAGLMGYPLRSPYAAAKWAVIGLMKTLAMELGPHGIRVNAICPGAVEGERMDRVIANEAKVRGASEAEVREGYVRGVSMRSFVSPGDIAEMAAYLASEAGRNISGQALSIDGHTETLSP